MSTDEEKEINSLLIPADEKDMVEDKGLKKIHAAIDRCEKCKKLDNRLCREHTKMAREYWAKFEANTCDKCGNKKPDDLHEVDMIEGRKSKLYCTPCFDEWCKRK